MCWEPWQRANWHRFQGLSLLLTMHVATKPVWATFVAQSPRCGLNGFCRLDPKSSCIASYNSCVPHRELPVYPPLTPGPCPPGQQQLLATGLHLCSFLCLATQTSGGQELPFAPLSLVPPHPARAFLYTSAMGTDPPRPCRPPADRAPRFPLCAAPGVGTESHRIHCRRRAKQGK